MQKEVYPSGRNGSLRYQHSLSIYATESSGVAFCCVYSDSFCFLSRSKRIIPDGWVVIQSRDSPSTVCNEERSIACLLNRTQSPFVCLTGSVLLCMNCWTSGEHSIASVLTRTFLFFVQPSDCVRFMVWCGVLRLTRRCGVQSTKSKEHNTTINIKQLYSTSTIWRWLDRPVSQLAVCISKWMHERFALREVRKVVSLV